MFAYLLLKTFILKQFQMYRKAARIDRTYLHLDPATHSCLPLVSIRSLTAKGSGIALRGLIPLASFGWLCLMSITSICLRITDWSFCRMLLNWNMLHSSSWLGGHTFGRNITETISCACSHCIFSGITWCQFVSLLIFYHLFIQMLFASLLH